MQEWLVGEANTTDDDDVADEDRILKTQPKYDFKENKLSIYNKIKMVGHLVKDVDRYELLLNKFQGERRNMGTARERIAQKFPREGRASYIVVLHGIGTAIM